MLFCKYYILILLFLFIINIIIVVVVFIIIIVIIIIIIISIFSRFEANGQYFENSTLGVQLIPNADIEWMRGDYNSSDSNQQKSMIISVFYFTLMGTACNVCDIEESPAGPFVSYICEGDTFQTLCARLSGVTGESNEIVSKYRLAVVVDNIPEFIPRPQMMTQSQLQLAQSANVDDTFAATVISTAIDKVSVDDNGDNNYNNNDENSAEAAKAIANNTNVQSGLIWRLFKDKFPAYAQNNLNSARKFHPQNRQFDCYPCLGIQRSVSSTIKTKG